MQAIINQFEYILFIYLLMRIGVGQFEGPLVWTRFGSRFEYYYGFRGWKANQIILPYSTKAIRYIIYLEALINQPSLTGY